MPCRYKLNVGFVSVRNHYYPAQRHASKTLFTQQNMPRMPAAFPVAQALGAKLGLGALLLQALPECTESDEAVDHGVTSYFG